VFQDLPARSFQAKSAFGEEHDCVIIIVRNA